MADGVGMRKELADLLHVEERQGRIKADIGMDAAGNAEVQDQPCLTGGG